MSHLANLAIQSVTDNSRAKQFGLQVAEKGVDSLSGLALQRWALEDLVLLAVSLSLLLLSVKGLSPNARQ